MKLLKKCSLVALALILCTSSIATTNVEATGGTYLQGDVDGDGSVTLSDLGYLANFLHGYKGSANDNMTQRLDVDLSGIIDQNDINMLSNIIIGNRTSDSLDYVSLNSGIPAQETSVYYKKYNAQTGLQIGADYSLDPLSIISDQESRSIIGTDDRERNRSKSGVVKLNYYKNNKWYNGSGFIVGENLILTAAHCLFDTATNCPVSNLYYTTYDSNGNQYSVATAASYHIPKEYVDLQSHNSYCDYALIKVNQNFSDEDNFEIYDLGIARDIIKNNINSTVYETTSNSKLKIYVSGYSGRTEDNSDNLNLRGYIATGYGNLVFSNINDDEIYYSSDTIGGESGGPVYLKTSEGENIVIGIHSGGYNSNSNVGKRINLDILQFVYNNPHI